MKNRFGANWLVSFLVARISVCLPLPVSLSKDPRLGGMRLTLGGFLGAIIGVLIQGPADTYLDASSMENVWFAYIWIYWPVLLIYSVIGYLTPEDD